MDIDKATIKVKPIINFLSVVIGIPYVIWNILITWTAIFGGRAPLFFVDFNGFNLVRGTLWFIFVAPTVVLVSWFILYIIIMLFALPIMLIMKMTDK